MFVLFSPSDINIPANMYWLQTNISIKIDTTGDINGNGTKRPYDHTVGGQEVCSSDCHSWHCTHWGFKSVLCR
jgi:hypothetical protein